MNRIDIRNYYRKAAGYLSMFNSVLLFIVSCLAIYIADFDELDVDAGTGLVMLNGLYVIFVVGLVFGVLTLIGGIAGVTGEGEGNFKFQRFNGVISTLLMILSVVIVIYVLGNKEVNWIDDMKGVTILSLVLSIFAAVSNVFVAILTTKGSKYYDSRSGFAKDVPDMDEVRPKLVHMGIQILCGVSYVTAVGGLNFYFAKMVAYHDKALAEHNNGFITLYYIMFVLALLITVVALALSVSAFFKTDRKLKKAGKAVILVSLGYIVLFVVVGVISMTKEFVKNQCPDLSYIIFAFVLCVLAVLYLASALKKTK